MAMSRNEIKDKLSEVMKLAAPSSALDFSGISESASLVDDLGLSSVGILYVVIAIEEFFNIRFDDMGFSDFKSIGDVIDYIEKKTNE